MSTFRWKVHEACMLCMGSVRNLVIDTVKSGKVQFDILAFLESVVLADMNVTGKENAQFNMILYLSYQMGNGFKENL